MIYDEGFEIRVEGLNFFAFSRYDLTNKDGVQHNVSRCGETMRGWYHNAEATKFGCYVAKKVQQPISLVEGPVYTRRAPSPSYDKPLHRQSIRQRVRRINLMQKSWRAKVYDR